MISFNAFKRGKAKKGGRKKREEKNIAYEMRVNRAEKSNDHPFASLNASLTAKRTIKEPR